MSDGDKTPYRAAIFTAIPLEYQAVCAHLTNLREERIQLDTPCERGEFFAGKRQWEVIVVETGAGTTRAATRTAYIIGHFKPQVVLFVGIAGGIKDVKLGDVVVASKVYSYESGRADPHFQSRPEIYQPTRRILQRARAVARKDDWLERLKENFSGPDAAPKVIVAPIASGNLVVASIDAEVLQLVRSHFNDTTAIEMEGSGFLESASLYQEIESLIIRGISDLIENKSETDKQQFQPLAAKRASTFAFEVLANLDIAEQTATTKETPTVAGQQTDHVPPQATSQGEENQTSSLLEEFNSSLPEYIDKVKKIRHSLSQRTGFSTEQYRNALKWLDDIEKHIEQLLHPESLTPMTSMRTLLVAIQKQVRDLKPELEKFRRPFPFIKSPRVRRPKDNEYDHVITLCNILLAGLEQWLH